MSKKRVLVSGGAGYIGSHLVRYLLRHRYEVVVIDDESNSLVDFFELEGAICKKVDVRDRKKVTEIYDSYELEVVCHLAALADPRESERRRSDYFDVNVGGTINLIESAAKKKIEKFIFASSCSVYGQPGRLPVDEEAAINPVSFYGLTKQLSEEVLEYYAKTEKMEVITFRFFNVASVSEGLGLKQNDFRIIPKACRAVLVGDGFVLNGGNLPTKDGTCVRDYVHIKDVCELVGKVIENDTLEKAYHVYNVGSGVGTSNREILDLVMEISRKELELETTEAKKEDPSDVVADVGKIKNELGWESEVGINQIIGDVLNIIDKDEG